MINKYGLGVLVVSVAVMTSANEQIDQAIDDLMANSCLTNRRVASHVAEWGIPDSVSSEPLFTNLVSVVSREYGNCTVSFLEGMTNEVKREVFVGALAKCGQEVYKNAVAGWFGGENLPLGSTEVIKGFAMPSNAAVGEYFILHYNEPGVSNVWANLKSLYLASSNTVAAARLCDITSGKTKAYLEMMKDLEREGTEDPQ